MSRSDVEVPAFWTLFLKPKLTSDPKDSIAWKGSEHLIGVISKVDGKLRNEDQHQKMSIFWVGVCRQTFSEVSSFHCIPTYITFFSIIHIFFSKCKKWRSFLFLSLFFWKRMLNFTSSCMADLSSWQLIQEIKGLRIFHHPIMDGIENGRDAAQGWWRKGNGFEKIKSAPYCCWLVLSFLKLETSGNLWPCT